jgi:branched-chain amino acid transport system permease protein
MAVVLTENTPRHRAYVAVSWAALAVLVVFIPAIFGQLFDKVAPANIDRMSEVLCYAVGILGLNLLIGFSGQLSIGHSAFVGLGMYTTAILVADHDWNYLVTLVVAVPLCFVVGVALGVPALRIRGLYLAVVTLAVAAAFPTLVRKFESLTGGSNGLTVRSRWNPPGWTPWDNNDYGRSAWMYFTLLAITVVLFLLARNLLRSRAGRAVVAIRDNQISAAVAGVNVSLYKTLIFGVSAAYAGIAGVMFVMLKRQATDTFPAVELSINLVIGLVVGGAATISGAVPGALLLVWVVKTMRDAASSGVVKIFGVELFSVDFLKKREGGGQVATVLLGLLLLLVVFVLPGGVVAGVRKLRAKIVQVVPNPSWLAQRRAGTSPVPSGGSAPAQAAQPDPVP